MTYFDLPLEELKSYQPPGYEPEDFDFFGKIHSPRSEGFPWK